MDDDDNCTFQKISMKPHGPEHVHPAIHAAAGAESVQIVPIHQLNST